MPREPMQNFVGLADIDCESAMFDDEDLADFGSIRSHDYTPQSVRVWQAARLGEPIGRVTKLGSILKGVDSVPNEETNDVSAQIVANEHHNSEQRGLGGGVDVDVVEGRDAQVVGRAVGGSAAATINVASSAHANSEQAHFQTTTDGGSHREMVNKSVPVSQAKARSEFFNDDDLDDLKATRGHDYSPQSVAQWTEGRNATATDTDTGKAAENDGKHGAGRERVDATGSSARAAGDAVGPAGGRVSAARDMKELTAVERTRARAADVDLLDGRALQGKDDQTGTGVQELGSPVTPAGPSADWGSASGGRRGAVSRALKRMAGGLSGSSKVREAVLAGCQCGRVGVEAVLQVVVEVLLGGSVVERRDGLRARVPVRDWESRAVQHLGFQVMERDRGCDVIVRRRFGDSFRIGNGEFEWVINQIHSELVKGFPVQRPVYK